MRQEVYDEARTMFNDFQVKSAAVTPNDEVFALIHFARYGLYEVGVYAITPRVVPLAIFTKSPRCWDAEIYFKRLARKLNATVLRDGEEMQYFLSGVKVEAA